MRVLFAVVSFSLVLLAGLVLWLSARADALVLRLHGARRLHFEEAPRRHALLAHLSLAARVACPRLYWVRGARPGAFSLGTRRWNTCIVLTRAALEELDEVQLRAVLAHELAHIAHWHTRRATVVAALAALGFRATSVLGALLARMHPSFGPGAALHRRARVLVRAVGARLRRLGKPSERVFLADRTAARLLGDPSGLAAVLHGLKAHVDRAAPTAGEGPHFMAPAERADIDARITALRALAAEEHARREGGLRLRADRRPSRFFPRSRPRRPGPHVGPRRAGGSALPVPSAR